jgi:LysR family transcriptional regulator, hydrogen peroxide-inducible genes activator
MNLTHLKFASEVASSNSFTVAAAKCHVTQPTLSNGIAQLESELGLALFVRTTRKVSLTPMGEQLMPSLQAILSAQSTLVQQAQKLLYPGQRLIRIGTSPLINSHLLGLMMEPFRLDHPEVDVVLREMNMADLHQMLDQGLLDFVLGVTSEKKASWVVTDLYEEPLCFIPRGTSWAERQGSNSVKIKDIADETYVMVPDACGLSRTTRALFRSSRRKLREYSGEAMSYQVLQQWASLGIGAAILPKSRLTSSSQTAYSIKDKSGQAINIQFQAIWLRSSSKETHLRDFVDHLRKIVPTIVDGLVAKP